MPASRSGLDTLSEKSSTFNQHSTNTSAAHSAEQGTAQPPHSPHNSGHYLLNPLLLFPKKSLDFSVLGILNSPQCRMSSQGHQKGSSGTQDPGNLLGEALQAQPISPHQPQSTQKWASLKTAALHFSLNRKPGVYCPSNVFLKTPAVSIWGPTARANSCSSFLPCPGTCPVPGWNSLSRYMLQRGRHSLSAISERIIHSCCHHSHPALYTHNCCTFLQ